MKKLIDLSLKRIGTIKGLIKEENPYLTEPLYINSMNIF